MVMATRLFICRNPPVRFTICKLCLSFIYFSFVETFNNSLTLHRRTITRAKGSGWSDWSNRYKIMITEVSDFRRGRSGDCKYSERKRYSFGSQMERSGSETDIYCARVTMWRSAKLPCWLEIAVSCLGEEPKGFHHLVATGGYYRFLKRTVCKKLRS